MRCPSIPGMQISIVKRKIEISFDRVKKSNSHLVFAAILVSETFVIASGEVWGWNSGSSVVNRSRI